ncbi:MAG TPA: bifunctional demethylmenaquinone methyltransferase/2-methoxy-6-polyprenyl-1,4-benzoquinol methylase UbiE [Alphaproteobacteria bacterium]|nr:bifunctional demethylmenaquinone methyltransferase/2-methoxy-6-polyprenyl-1,4-benzoquinol methylase UbiE [Alphaproteobacteria bacterium]
MQNEQVNFGFQKVSSEEKTGKVFDVFKSVASKYDIMNDFMSFGLHHIWKRIFVNKIEPKQNSKLLDLAAGSGDISYNYLKNSRTKNIKTEVVVSDINENMLEQSKPKFFDANFSKDIKFEIINAEEIPYPDNHFDFCTISFGIRNVTDIPKALSEIHRVLKPGGKFLCLEFSPVEEGVIKKIYDTYSFNVIPKVGKLITGDEASYQYLVESIRVFPKSDDFKNMLENAEFKNVRFEKLTFGVVAIHTGWKI